MSFMSYSPSIAMAVGEGEAQSPSVATTDEVEQATEQPTTEIQPSAPEESAPIQESSETPADDASQTTADESSSAASSSQESSASASSAASGSASSASASSASAAASDEPKTIEKTLPSTSGGSYTVKVKYDKAAGIPDGSTIEIIEYTQEPDDPNWRSDPAYADRPLSTERIVGKDYLKQRATVASRGLGAQDTDYVFFAKFLDVAIVYDGQEIAPQAAVEVTIETTAVDVACSDGLGFVRMAHDEGLAGDEQALKDGWVTGDGKTSQSLNAANQTYDKDAKTDRSPADDQVVRLQCSTKEFGELAVVGVAVPQATLWQADGAMAQVLGPAAQGISAYEIDAAGLGDGDELLGAYAFGTSPARDYGTMLWARVVAADGKGAADEKAAKGLAAAVVSGGSVAGAPVALGAPDHALAFNSRDGVAFLRESAGAASQAGRSSHPAANDNPNVLEQRLPAANGGTYVVRMAYGPADGIPEGATLQVRELSGVEYQQHKAQVVQTLEADQVTAVRALDIAVRDENGNKVAVAGDVDVSITLEGAAAQGDSAVIHFGNEGPQVIASQQAAVPADETAQGNLAATSTIDFTASEFSVYAIAYIAKTRELTASDGSAYRVSVSYGPNAGIPEDAELLVSEVKQGDAGFDAYIEQSNEARGMSADDVALAKAFDIKLVDPATGEEFQPTASVKVGIELLDANLNEFEDVGVVHIRGDADDQASAEVVNAYMNGAAVEFATDGFSVYVVTGAAAVPQCTYSFFVWDDSSHLYQPYPFTDDKGDTVYAQTVRSGDQLVIPQLADTDERVFAGWYEGDIEGGQVVLAEKPYDFDNIAISENSAVYLYAVYTNYASVIFHDQYNAESDSFPIAFTRRAELTGDPGTSPALVQIDDVSATYTSSEGEQMGFFGWSRTPISTPGAATDDQGNPVSAITWASDDENAGFIEVSETTHLYPIFKGINRLSFYSGPTGSGASYIPSTAYFSGEGPTSLPVASREGYTFDGWYAGSLPEGSETVNFGARITNADGTLVNTADDGNVYISNGKLMLRDDATLYARWVDHSIAYKILIWKQKTTDAPDANPKSYDLVESIAKSAAPDSVVSVDNEYKNAPEGYTLASYSPDTTVDENGYTVLHVYFDREGAYEPSGALHALKFVDSSNTETVYYQSSEVGYTDSITALVPSDPEATQKGNSGQKVFSFNGWFADPLCSTQVFFDKASYDAYTGYNQKVLYDTMPDNDLTLYAGWAPDWYVVQIDPNYGTFNGTGGTWFWETFDGELVQEYTQVTRDYVPSSSGTYFYVKHDRAFYGYTGNEWDNSEPDRETRYTQTPGEATEDTTFEYAPGEYTYAGWYEVHADGTETRYDFSKHVDHDLMLKLHWKKNGTYYLGFNAGEGTLPDGESKDEVLPEGYADYAEVVLSRAAIAPAGFTFVGWQVREADDGRIYAPGQTLTLHADNAVRSGGREIIQLDAVYAKLDTASVVYDANGGTINVSEFDYGQVPGSTTTQEWVAAAGLIDAERQTATVSGLANNSRFKLGSGAGLVKEGAEFLGWSDEPVCDSSATFYAKDSADTYAVDSAEPKTLYAVWGVKVTYHLNNENVGATWGGTGEGGAWEAPYVLDSGNYVQTVNLNTAVAEPPYIPQNGDASRMFRYWSTSATGDAPYDFSASVTGDVDLYAHWSDPITVPVHAVDASQAALADKTNDSDWDVPANANIVVSTEGTALGATGVVTAPADYEFAFAAVATGLGSVSEEGAVTAIKYDTATKGVVVKHAGEEEFTALPDGSGIYFVYYQNKQLPIGYVSMSATDELTAVTVSGAPTNTGDELLGAYDMGAIVTDPLAWADGSTYAHYAFAIGGANPQNANDLSMLTAAASSDDSRPALRVRNTWRGFEYSADSGESWTSCGYEPNLYVVYFTMKPTVVTFHERTLAPEEHRGTPFSFNYEITQTTTAYDAGGNVVGKPAATSIYSTATPHKLKDGEAHSAILFYSETQGTPEGGKTVVAQTITITQTAHGDFTTKVDGTSPAEGQSATYTFTATGADESQDVVFENTYKSHPITIHVARVEQDGMSGGIVLRDELRNTAEATYSYDLPLGESVDLLTALPARPQENEENPEEPIPGVFAGDTDTYAFGAIMYGTSTGGNGSAVNVGGMGVASVSYERVGEGGSYNVVLKDAGGNPLGELGANDLYYLYYPMPQIKYVKEDIDGNLIPITGAIRNAETGVVSPSSAITYGFAELTMNGKTVTQAERFEIPQTGFVISQDGGKFRMPPILDDGVYERYLTYAKIGAGNDNAPSVSSLEGSSDGLAMSLEVRDNTLQYSFDGETWANLPLSGTPTIYAIYTERGYDLQISKTVDVTQSGNNSLFTDTTFTVTISSTAITKESYAAEGAPDAMVQASPASGSTPGTITLQVKDGAQVKLKGMPRGDYVITESGNENYNLSAKAGPIVGGSTRVVDVANNSTIGMALGAETRLDLTNSPKPICKIDNVVFYTLRSAMDYVDKELPDRTATVEMLTDYLMPPADTMEVLSGCDVTLTTAEDADYLAVITRSQALTDEAPITNNGSLKLEIIALDGDDVASTTPMIQSSGDLTVGDGAVIRNAVSSGNGGAVNATAGDISIRGTIEDCAAAAGGAIYHLGTSTITLSGTGSIEGCEATSGNGGGIYATNGTIEVLGTSRISNNTAMYGNGGAIHVENATVTIGENGIIGAHDSVAGNSARDGGAIYAVKGAINISATEGVTPPAVTGNTATDGSGGAIWIGAGTVAVAGGTLSSNTATVNGGAVYAQAASVDVTGGYVAENEATNGSAVFLGTGSGHFSGGSITNNEATAGGAVGIGSDSCRLYFSARASITGNTMGEAQSNVYLDQDSDMVINASGLSEGASVGIYVPGAQGDPLFTKRGDIGGRFGSYASADNLAGFSNDRLPGLEVVTDANRGKLYWSKPISVEIRYLEAFNSGFPPSATGSTKYANTSYAPTSSDAALSEVADDLRATFSTGLAADAVYATSFADGASTYADYITRLAWDNASSEWKIAKRDGSAESLGDRKIIIYYSKAAYYSIENNTDYPLDISSLSVTVQGSQQSLINSGSVAGYGVVFARNGAIQSALLPFEGDDDGKAVLEPGDAVTLMLPGGRGLDYSMTGAFDEGGTDSIRVRRTNEAETTMPANAPISFTGRTLANDGTYQVIFGDDKPICKIVDNNDTENIFTTIGAALAYASQNRMTSVKIEMLVDYLMPGNDVLEIAENASGFENLEYLELTTATDGTYHYNGERATISRANGNTAKPLVYIQRNATTDTEVSIHDIDFDGKSVQGNINGGAIMTKYCKASIENADFKNCIANNGGAVFISFGDKQGTNKFNVADGYDIGENPEKAIAHIENCTFTNCRSQESNIDRMGGGAILTNGRLLDVRSCKFIGCSSGSQAGAVFHRIEMQRGDFKSEPYNTLSQTYVEDCEFTDCSADRNAGGGMESDAFAVTVIDSSFTNCVAKNSHGGGFNTYIAQQTGGTGWGDAYDTSVTVRGCSFIECTALWDGGGFHSASNTTLVENSSFENCSARYGGAIALNNGTGGDAMNTDEGVVRGVTVKNCSATSQQGGGIYAGTKTLTVGDYVYTDSSGVEQTVSTEISNCTAAGNGGGLAHVRTKNGQADSWTVIEGATISNCVSNWYGGGVFVSTRTMTLTDCTVENCIANGGTQYSEGGGGVYLKGNDNNNSSGTVDHCTIRGNKTAYRGGGLYVPFKTLTICNDTEITGNTADRVEWGAGAFLPDNVILTIGTDALRDAGLPDNTTINGNTTTGGVTSNLRLPENGGVNRNNVIVLCDLSGYIGVANAKKAGTQFGTSPNSTDAWRPAGLSDIDAVFRSDIDTLKGIIDRLDASGKKIIWAGPPICKLTDGDDNLLYFKPNGSDPAIFDKLDDGTGNHNRSAPFNLLRKTTIALYYSDGRQYEGPAYKIKMLVESYTANNRILLVPYGHIDLTFTTAGVSDDDGYPYTGRRGSQATVLRGFNGNTNFVEFNANGNGNKNTQVLITNLTLDGNRSNITSQENTRVMNLNGGNAMRVTLGPNAILQNANNSTGSNGGAGVYVYQALLTMAGGTIRNCSAPNGGAVTIESRNSNVVGFVFEAGNITNCTATQKGGAVYVRQNSGNSAFEMKGGTISRCSAAQGGGVFVDNNNKMSMSGGSIVNNNASSLGGGIAFGGANSRLYLSGRVNVSGNTRTGSLASNGICNVELNQDSNGVINTNNGGLFPGSYIGVYVPDGSNLYGKHGQEKQPFGTFANGDNTANLYGFVNDRNGLKGGIIEDPAPNTIYWIQIFSLKVTKEVEASDSVYIDPNEEFSFTVNIRGQASAAGQKDAKDIDSETGFYGDMEFTSNGTDTTTATFKLKAGESITGINLSEGLDYEVIENLTTDQAKRYAPLPSNVIAKARGIGENKGRTDIDPYTSDVTFANLAPVCKITDNSGNLLYKRYESGGKTYVVPAVYKELTGDDSAFKALEGVLYQNSAGNLTYNIDNGAQVHMLVQDYTLTDATEVKRAIKATLTTASPEAAAFPYQGTNVASTVKRGAHVSDGSLFTVKNGGDLTIGSVVLDGAKASYPIEGNGGIANVESGGKLAILGGATLQNSKAASGGAVYVASGGTVTMTGGTIWKNESVENGAGIYLEQGSTLNLSGNVSFGGKGTDIGGNIRNRDGNLQEGSLIAKLNGGKAYERARQDIYLAEGGETPASIVLTGNMSGDAGGIWVWAESENHYVTMKPFATVQAGKSVDGATYAMFRNARSDDVTLCGGDTYLSGSAGEVAGLVYWSGGFDVQFNKIDGFGTPQSGATFTLYTDAACANPLAKGGEAATATSDASGAVLFEQVPGGIYYMKETRVPAGYVNANTYVVLVGATALQGAGTGVLAGLAQSDIAAQVGTGNDAKDAAVFLYANGRATATPNIEQYGLMNISATERKVILKKVNGSFEPLEGARFDILRYDRTVVASDTVSYANGAFWIGNLPYGTYYLHETGYPTDTPRNWWFTLTVDAAGATVSDRS